jgi:enediyne biosynthesis protein E4
MVRLPNIITGVLILITVATGCSPKKETLFVSLPSSTTNISFVNTLQNKKMFNILYYLYFYNGGGVAVGDINNDGLEDIYFTANSKAGNKLYLNKGNFVFEDITANAKVAGTADWCTGATMADVNNDGYLDIYVSTVSSKYGLTGHNELFINNKNNTFTESSQAYGLNTSCFSTQTAFFDYDKDGDLDCYILNQSHHPHANIVDTVNRKGYDTLSGDRLYRNEMNTAANKFVDVSAQAGIYQSNLGYGLGIAIADINNDGWDDIYIGNDFHENDYYYINNGYSSATSGRGEVTFTESSAKHFKHYSRFSMGNDVADYNNDGQLDIVTVDMLPPDEKILKTYGSDENPDIYKVKLELRGYQNQYSKNCLQQNNGNGVSFSETALQSGVAATDWSWCPLFADFDNDGNKDLFISSGIVKRPVDLDFIRFADKQKAKGIDSTDKYDEETIAAMPDGASHSFLFKGNGKMSFTDVSEDWGTASKKGYFNGAAYSDLDNDGNLDLVINCINAPAVILKNNAPKKNYLSLSFKTDSTGATVIGTKAYVFANGKMQYQQAMPTRGFMSSSTTQLHFGLDSATTVDSVLIVWPQQNYQVIKNLAINRSVEVLRQDAQSGFVYNNFFPAKKELLQNITAQVNCNWQHQENDFLDYNVQYLIPHSLSTRSPRLAVADVNKDGLDDFYVCGAKFQPGVLMVQQANGTFKQSDTAQFNKFAISEEVDAVFFDANGDSYQDLFILTGGNEMPANEVSLLDRLYLNDGTGHFTRELNAMSVVYENKSCAITGDIDNDGDIDLFVGNLASPVNYGKPTTSYLFLNDGKAHFTKAGDNIIPLTAIGMVTAASFIDIDNDGWKDLAITGEWMPIKIFKNNKGKFIATDIASSTGLWQSLYATDINGDGFTDLLGGNWGWNSKLWSGKNGPLKLYVKDFDNNGKIEQILAYTINNKQYPFLAKDELERALPVLKKAYLKYSEVAGKTVDYILYDLFKDYTELNAEVQASSCFINNGKGSFNRVDLPEQLQMAPVFSFAQYSLSNVNKYLAAGNFYGVIPYEGRYDALQPSVFSFAKENNQLQYEQCVASFDGQVRDAKWINYAGGNKVLILAANNKHLQFFKLNN